MDDIAHPDCRRIDFLVWRSSYCLELDDLLPACFKDLGAELGFSMNLTLTPNLPSLKQQPPVELIHSNGFHGEGCLYCGLVLSLGLRQEAEVPGKAGSTRKFAGPLD